MVGRAAFLDVEAQVIGLWEALEKVVFKLVAGPRVRVRGVRLENWGRCGNGALRQDMKKNAAGVGRTPAALCAGRNYSAAIFGVAASRAARTLGGDIGSSYILTPVAA